MKHVVLTASFCLTIVMPASAASVDCTPGGKHPVCAANYASYPKGSLAMGQSSSGSAVVDGKQVKWTCIGGQANPDPKKNVPRKCTY